jgi:choline dehydrogenase-like flavoprotein
MAGQGIQRREVLRILGTAAAAAHFPGFSTWGLACGHVGNAALQIKPEKFVTNRFGQTHDMPNLYVCDASVFLNCTDKTTTISILAFSLRTSEHLIENFRRGEHKAA